MSYLGDGLGNAFFTVVLGLIGVGMAISAVFDMITGGNSIRSEEPITPKIELIIKNNQVDTIYVYSLPKK